MTTELASLEKILSENPELKHAVFDSYPSKYLMILNELFEEVFCKGCMGIEAKVKETSSDLFRFQGFISELRIAQYFLRQNMQVELLSSNAFQGRKAPDMHVRSGSKEYFVEVKNIQLDDEDHNFGSRIAEALNSLGMTYMVVVKSWSSLSTPAYKYQGKAQKEKESMEALNEFKDKLKGLPVKASPVIVTTKAAEIELHPTNKGKSYLGITTMKEAITESPDYKERIRYDLLEKSKKREDWVGNELDKFYIVAIDDDTLFFYIDRYNMELFGKSVGYSPPLIVPDANISPEIEKAMKNGWTDYLKKMCILPNNRCIIPEEERGLFFSEPLIRNVSAVMAQHNNGFYLLANPFAEERINSPAILQELGNCFLGWEE